MNFLKALCDTLLTWIVLATALVIVSVVYSTLVLGVKYLIGMIVSPDNVVVVALGVLILALATAFGFMTYKRYLELTK